MAGCRVEILTMSLGGQDAQRIGSSGKLLNVLDEDCEVKFEDGCVSIYKSTGLKAAPLSVAELLKNRKANVEKASVTKAR